MTARKYLNKLKLDSAILLKKQCTEEEIAKCKELVKSKKELPENFFQDKDTGKFYTVCENGLSEEENNDLIKLLLLDTLCKIKGYLFFFVILAVLGLIFGFIGFLNLL